MINADFKWKQNFIYCVLILSVTIIDMVVYVIPVDLPWFILIWVIFISGILTLEWNWAVAFPLTAMLSTLSFECLFQSLQLGDYDKLNLIWEMEIESVLLIGTINQLCAVWYGKEGFSLTRNMKLEI